MKRHVELRSVRVPFEPVIRLTYLNEENLDFLSTHTQPSSKRPHCNGLQATHVILVPHGPKAFEELTFRPRSDRNLHRAVANIDEAEFPHSSCQRFLPEWPRVDSQIQETFANLVLEGIDGLN